MLILGVFSFGPTMFNSGSVLNWYNIFFVSAIWYTATAPALLRSSGRNRSHRLSAPSQWHLRDEARRRATAMRQWLGWDRSSKAKTSPLGRSTNSNCSRESHLWIHPAYWFGLASSCHCSFNKPWRINHCYNKHTLIKWWISLNHPVLNQLFSEKKGRTPSANPGWPGGGPCRASHNPAGTEAANSPGRFVETGISPTYKRDKPRQQGLSITTVMARNTSCKSVYGMHNPS